jgi:hypothetical protein
VTDQLGCNMSSKQECRRPTWPQFCLKEAFALRKLYQGIFDATWWGTWTLMSCVKNSTLQHDSLLETCTARRCYHQRNPEVERKMPRKVKCICMWPGQPVPSVKWQLVLNATAYVQRQHNPQECFTLCAMSTQAINMHCLKWLQTSADQAAQTQAVLLAQA